MLLSLYPHLYSTRGRLRCRTDGAPNPRCGRTAPPPPSTPPPTTGRHRPCPPPATSGRRPSGPTVGPSQSSPQTWTTVRIKRQPSEEINRYIQRQIAHPADIDTEQSLHICSRLLYIVQCTVYGTIRKCLKNIVSIVFIMFWLTFAVWNSTFFTIFEVMFLIRLNVTFPNPFFNTVL